MEKQHELQVDLDPDVLDVLSDKERLTKVLAIKRWFDENPGMRRAMRARWLSDEELLCMFDWSVWEAARRFGITNSDVLYCHLCYVGLI